MMLQCLALLLCEIPTGVKGGFHGHLILGGKKKAPAGGLGGEGGSSDWSLFAFKLLPTRGGIPTAGPVFASFPMSIQLL